MLCKEDFCSLDSSHDVWIAKSRTGGPRFVWCTGENKKYKILMELPLGSYRKRWEDNVKWDLSKIVMIIELLQGNGFYSRVLNFQVLLP
jgi:hypothetical protein